MNLTRRTALTGAVATAVIVSIPLKAAAKRPLGPVTGLHSTDIPVLYGDGIHDDTEALQAFLDGKVVGRKPRLEGLFGLRANHDGEWRPHLTGGTYLISKPLAVTKDFTTIRGVTFLCTYDGYLFTGLAAVSYVYTITGNKQEHIRPSKPL